MRLLITGALGHIGSSLIRNLAQGRYERIALLDNLSTQRFPSLFDLPAGYPFQFIEADICTADLERHVGHADLVVHLAAVTDAAGSVQCRDAVMRVNVEGSERVARACTLAGAALIALSTTSVYGSQRSVVDEACPDEELHPQSPYAESKLEMERMLARYGERHGLRFVVGRFGTIFGTSIGMRFHTAINKFVWNACLGEPLTVWRTAMHQVRPYLALGDAIGVLRFLMEHGHFDNRIYNAVTVNASVAEIIEIIRRHVPDVSIELVESAIMNQLSYEVSCHRLCQLGFRFSGELEAGIAETVRWLRNARSGGAN